MPPEARSLEELRLERLASLLRFVTRPAIALVALGLLVFLWVSPRPEVSLAFHGVALVGLAGVELLGWRGALDEAAALLVGLFWLIFAAACWLFDGVTSASMGGFLPVIVAAARELCVLLGGGLEAESEPGVGTTFRMTLPA